MQFSERELEDWFFENPSEFAETAKCQCGTFRWIGRQMQVPSGIIDLLGMCACRGDYPSLYVVELKAERLKSCAIGQVVRYAKDIDRAMDDATDYGPFIISKWCVGYGEISDAVQYEAEACDVHILTVKPTYRICGPWVWNEATVSRDEKQRSQIGEMLLSHAKAICVTSAPQESTPSEEEVQSEVTNS